MPNSPGSTPQLDDLLRVRPIVEYRQVGGVRLLVVSLETYRAGFLLHTQMSYPSDHRRTPEVIFEAADDGGTSYACWSSGGYGGGGSDGYMWRRDYVFAPGLRDGAAALRIHIAAIEWLIFDPAQPRPTIELTELVDWTIAIPLAE